MFTSKSQESKTYKNTQDQSWNDLNQLIKISDLNQIFLPKKSFDLNHEFD